MASDACPSAARIMGTWIPAESTLISTHGSWPNSMKFDAKQAPGCGPHPRPLSAVDTAYSLTQSVGFFRCPLDLGANGIESLLLQMVLEDSGFPYSIAPFASHVLAICR